MSGDYHLIPSASQRKFTAQICIFRQELATFKAQNRELNTQFKTKIQNADIVVADLTYNNPNVNFELGIALMQNKNILRVTGRSVTELGFDIRNLEVYRYEDDTGLTKRILEYLDVFFKIKQLEKSASGEFASLYSENTYAPKPLNLNGMASEKEPVVLVQPFPEFKLRDGKVCVDFEILGAQSPDQWFGIYFRAVMHPFSGSHLLYVRQDGRIEIAVYYPYFRVLPDKTSLGREVLGRHKMILEFDNNYLYAQMDEARLETYKLSYQEVGNVYLAALLANVNVYSAEVVCRDAIEYE